MEKPAPHTNRLAGETSPYLLQHAHNPVNWYPWGPEAFETARRENKPIFLSVGYSTCYWCHVMERESFENPAVAAEMNKRFVNIKVDREERPDVDQLYMLAVQVLTRHGGWPMSVFLLPDLRPFYGGTYYPAEDTAGRPGFVTILKAVESAFRDRPKDVQDTADQLTDILRQIAVPAGAKQPVRIDEPFMADLVERSTGDFDSRFGGFGGEPKFPRQTLLEMLLAYADLPSADVDADRASATRATRVLEMVCRTLDAMAAGGIRDQLGGGFHRYSTDARWLVPHFEIMLYDNAMLGWCYVQAYRQTQRPRYARIARGILDFVLREMTSPEGAFYTAFDAEVDAREGEPYLWTKEQVAGVLGPQDSADFCRVYGLDFGPNFADPHHGSDVPQANVLFLPDGIESEEEEDDTGRLARMRAKLLARRKKRKQPLLDTKVLTSWNALMIRALADAGRTLHEPRYTQAAASAARFILSRHRMPDGALARGSREGVAKHAGFLDDYAFLILALLELRRAGVPGDWADAASSLATTMIDRFGNGQSPAPAGGFYFTDRSADDVLVRQKITSDSPLPSGNAVAAMALMDLNGPDAARQTLAALAGMLQENAESASSLALAALLYVRRHGAFTVELAGDAGHPAAPTEPAGDVVTVQSKWTNDDELHILLRIAPGHHVNAHEAGGGLVPTELAIELPRDTDVAEIAYPPGERRIVASGDQPVSVYYGDQTIIVRFAKGQAESAPLRLRLRYQPCTEDACLVPVTKRFEIGPP